MRKHHENKDRTPLIVLLTCVVAVLLGVLIWLLATRDSVPTPDSTEGTTVPTHSAETSQPTEPTEPEEAIPLEIVSVVEQGDRVVVTTTYGVVQYPFAFSDLIRVEAENNDSRSTLAFSLVMGETAYPVYALHFGGSEGMVLGTVTLENGTSVGVYGEFAQFPESLPEADTVTYNAVQETFNDIVASLGENENFTPAP